jgi:hypothetical protein
MNTSIVVTGVLQASIFIGAFFVLKKPPKKEAQWKKTKKQNHRQDEATSRKAKQTNGQ